MAFQKSPISLKQGAIFVGDVHYHKGVREEFCTFLQKVRTPQLFLMGDIFDLLVGPIDSTRKENALLIEQINTLECEVYYLEGNHDFALDGIFQKALTIPRNLQPLLVQAGKKKVALSHGDRGVGGLYELYSFLIRQKSLLKVLNLCNRNGFIADIIQSYNAKKDLCRSLAHFKTIALHKSQMVDADIVIEGHYHQRKIYHFKHRRYINLPSFACTKEFLRYDGLDFFIDDTLS